MPSRQLDIETLTAYLRMTSGRSVRSIRSLGPSPSAACQSSGLLAVQGPLPTARGSFLNGRSGPFCDVLGGPDTRIRD
jgi:hypothetical protein